MMSLHTRKEDVSLTSNKQCDFVLSCACVMRSVTGFVLSCVDVIRGMTAFNELYVMSFTDSYVGASICYDAGECFLFDPNQQCGIEPEST